MRAHNNQNKSDDLLKALITIPSEYEKPLADVFLILGAPKNALQRNNASNLLDENSGLPVTVIPRILDSYPQNMENQSNFNVNLV